MTSYITLLSKIEQFCNAHLQIKKYGGEFREQMPNFSTKDEKYPIVFVEPVSDLEDLNTNQFSINVYCVDIIQKDRANLNTIVSDCQLILKDMYVYYINDMDAQLDVVGTSTMTPVNNFDSDYVAGWQMSITFEVSTYGACEIPMNPIHPVEVICEPGIVENSDGSYTETVASGGLLILPDINLVVKDQNGNILSDFNYPSVQDEEIEVYIEPCADVYVHNTNKSYEQTVASGDTLQLPDINIQVIDQNDNVLSNSTYPSVQDETISVYVAPCADVSYRIADEADNTLYLGNIVSGGSLDQVINNSDVSNSNDSYTASILAQSNLELPDVTFNVNNSVGTQVNTAIVPSVINQTLVAPDATLHLKKVGNGTIHVEAVPSGVTENYIVADNDITVNQVNPFSIHATDPLNIRLHNQSGSDIVPQSVVYQGNSNHVTITVNTASFTPVGATLMKTGQTTSYNSNDDGATQRGRLTNRLTLPSNNPFGNTSRFTNKTGGTTYPVNKVTYDWSTFDGTTVLAYYFGDMSSTRSLVNQCDQYVNTIYDGLRGWYLTNIQEMINILDWGRLANYQLNYPPFNTTLRYFWVSTQTTGTSGVATDLAGVNPFTATTKTNGLYGMWCRVCTVSGTTIS